MIITRTAELCALSESRIYPGRGILFIRRDGKPIWLASSKAYSLTLQRKKPAKLAWTQAWRRLHKKTGVETSTKKRSRKTTKVQRAVVGASLEEIKKRASQKAEFRSAQREAALKEAKESKKAASATKKATAKASFAHHNKAPKHMGGKGNRGSTGR